MGAVWDGGGWLRFVHPSTLRNALSLRSRRVPRLQQLVQLAMAAGFSVSSAKAFLCALVSRPG